MSSLREVFFTWQSSVVHITYNYGLFAASTLPGLRVRNNLDVASMVLF
jgi:hypothetical protein